MLPFFSSNQYVLEGFQTSCSFDFIGRSNYNRLIIVLMNVFGFFIPILIICSCYILILIYLRKHADYKRINNLISVFKTQNRFSNSSNSSSTNCSMTSNQSNSSAIRLRNVGVTNNQRMRKMRILRNYNIELKITKNALFIIIAFCGTWLPYSIISIVGQYSNHREYYVTPLTTLLAVIMAKSSAVFNPIIYIYSSENFRKKIFSKIFKQTSN